MHKSLIIVLNQTLVGLLCWNLRKNTEEDLVLFSKEYQSTLLSVILIWRFNLVLKVTKKIQIWKLRMIFFMFFFLEESIFKSSYMCVYVFEFFVFYLCVLYACVHMTVFVFGIYMSKNMWQINEYICMVYLCLCTHLWGMHYVPVYAYWGVYLTCAVRSWHLMFLFFPPSIGTAGTHSHN